MSATRFCWPASFSTFRHPRACPESLITRTYVIDANSEIERQQMLGTTPSMTLENGKALSAKDHFTQACDITQRFCLLNR
jgi:hypothetical protein